MTHKISGLVKNPWLVVSVLLFLMVGLSVWYSGSVEAKYNEGVVISDHVKGNSDASVTLLEYSDFECPACAQFQPKVEEIMAQYGDKIKFEYRHYPLIQIHKYAEIAALAAESAGQQGKFFEFQNMLFANQRTWAESNNPAQYFTEYATSLGLDIEKFKRQQKSSILRNRVKANLAEARSLNLTATPSFFLNGQKMEIKSFDDFIAQIEAVVNPKADFSLPEEPIRVVPVESV